MEHYIRFQTALRCEWTDRPLGVFQAAGRLEDASELSDAAREWLEHALEWFNRRLEVPELGPYGWRSIFWFRTDSRRCIARIWDVVAVLREEGIGVQMQRTSDPGRIIYRDHFQIAAVPRRRRARTRFSRQIRRCGAAPG